MTMKAGRPRRVMIVPCTAPMAAQTSRATRIAAHHGQPTDWRTSSAITTPPIPLTKPIDRSISPSSRGNTIPMARSM